MDYQQRYYLEHREKMLEQIKNYHKTTEGKKSLDRARKKERDNLTDNYIRQALYTKLYNTYNTKIKRSEITQEQIEMYRTTLKAKRELKRLKYEIQ